MDVSRLIQMIFEITGCFFCIICCLYIFVGHKVDSKRCLILVALLLLDVMQLISDAGAIAFRGNTTTFGWFMVRITNYLVFMSNFAMGFVGFMYVEQFLKAQNKKSNHFWKCLILGICGFSSVLITISQFTGYLYKFDDMNRYYREDGFMIISVLGAVLTVSMVFYTLHYRSYMKPIQYRPLIAVYLLPLVADFIQIKYYGISFANLAMMTGIVIMFFCFEIERSEQIIEQQKKIFESQVELEKQKSQLMLSQIRPHFLFNTLGSIEALCEVDPMMAKQTIHKFSKYLRTNINSLKENDLTYFEKELDYTEAYLWIEKMRFQEKINVEYNIEVRNFMLPTLTLQPLVENAVRHGICQKRKGGTIKLSTQDLGDYILISIEDDGVGFDPRKVDSERVHVGIDNVRSRIQLMCNGSVSIDSRPGEGTVCTICIKKILKRETKLKI